MFNTSDMLKKILRDASTEELGSANMYVTKETIYSRMFDKVGRMLSNVCHQDTSELAYVHPQVSNYLSRCVPPEHEAFDLRDRLLVRHIYANDYHDAQMLDEYCSLLDSKFTYPDSLEQSLIYRAFGADGFRGHSLVDYVENLRFPFCYDLDENVAEKEVSPYEEEHEEKKNVLQKHLGAVRMLYARFDPASMETVEIALRNAIGYVESADPELREMTDAYLEYVMEFFEDVKKYLDLLKDTVEEKVMMKDEAQ